MNKNFDSALENAFDKEFSWLDAFENPYASYKFSSQFESSMNTIIPKAEFTYVSIGKRRIRKTLLAALVALLAILITGCAFGVYYLVEWNEVQNDKQGTLDITFDITGEPSSDSNTSVVPKTPAGYTITEQFDDDSSCIIVYSDAQQNQIIYSRSNDIENMSVSIDNEDAIFKETIINGYKGYTSSKEGVHALYWVDSTYFYELQGTCDIDVLFTMAESMVN
ncbi:MAG: DUF4367 domain-containing protein [Firmicutes bacterium]|nr:DUF4367 domain-containing protein [Bacillota bacterium]